MRFQKSAMMAKKLDVSNVRVRTEEGEEGGDAGELTPARSIRFTDIALTKNQFNELVGSDFADEFYFDYGQKPPKSAHERLPKIPLDIKFKNCTGSIIFGVSKQTLEFEGGKVKNLSIKLKGQKAWGTLSLTLQAVLPRKLDTLDLEEHFGDVVTLQLTLGEADLTADEAQAKLELAGGETAEDRQEHGDDDHDDDGDETAGKSRDRAPAGDEQRPH